MWSSAPSVIARIAQAEADEPVPSSIRIALLCGEPLSLDVLRYCQTNMAIPHVFNFYGLTETGVENFFHECRSDDVRRYQAYGYVPIGWPLPGNGIRVTENKELLLSGVQLTPGYLDGAGQDRFEIIDGQRWFHTGDVLEHHQGVWFCKGRLDSQIKLNGYRIELMDIEVNLKRQPGVAEAVCFVEEAGDRKRLAAVLQPADAETVLDLNLIRREIAKSLPSYMIPARMEIVEQLPYNANGKIDRRQVSERHASA
ncbi:AMP-binding protein [Methylogaea oryzae]|uniref:AMP-binding protein n=1 Tax=Methylogaea oryzae TaxID=1295382 RepID=UPI0020D0FE77|nr:AMP-binding protein [Methylogaea oryzae]